MKIKNLSGTPSLNIEADRRNEPSNNLLPSNDDVRPSSDNEIPSSSFSPFIAEFRSVGAKTRANDIISTRRQVLGCAVCPEQRAKEACSFRTCAAKDIFWLSNVLIRFNKFAFSSVVRFTLQRQKFQIV